MKRRRLRPSSGFCTASSSFGELGGLSQIKVTSLQAGITAASVPGSASFSDRISVPAGAFEPASWIIRGELEGLFAGLDSSAKLFANDTFEFLDTNRNPLGPVTLTGSSGASNGGSLGNGSGAGNSRFHRLCRACAGDQDIQIKSTRSPGPSLG